MKWTIILLFITFGSYAQKNDGVYFSYESFVLGVSDVPFFEDIDFSNKSNHFGIQLSSKDLRKALRKEYEKEVNVKNIWGIIYKDKIFINHGKTKKSIDYGIPINPVAGNLALTRVVKRNTNKVLFVKLIVQGTISLSMEGMMFSISDTSKRHKVKVSSFKKLISYDQELLELFNREKQKKNKIIPYIKLYNKRNPLT